MALAKGPCSPGIAVAAVAGQHVGGGRLQPAGHGVEQRTEDLREGQLDHLLHGLEPVGEDQLSLLFEQGGELVPQQRELVLEVGAAELEGVPALGQVVAEMAG
ncbi:hypothetical protein PG991_014381 [Apiospora marii]|uniref:Uncharacterized protein n=2 Tax=Apiospora marii TaxID=335849 RepID=A0ABR1RAL6_9PEZI